MGSDSFWEWFVWFRSPADIAINHRSYLVAEYAYYVLALLTLSHACRSGGRYVYLWFTTILHGLVVESLSYFLPDIDSFWHAQSSVMFLGGRLPLHIVLFYPVFLYTAAVATSRLRLRGLVAGAAAMGLGVVLLDVPFDIMGIKLLWWTWHDTDPNIYDRHYWVPWTSYYFHAAFASSFYVLFFGTRKLLTRTEKFESDGFGKELVCSMVTGLFAMPTGVLQFVPIYHPLHDVYGIHTEVCVFLLLLVYGLIIWTADRHPAPDARPETRGGAGLDEILVHVVLHYTLYVLLVLLESPENIKSTGLHEPTGDCSATSPLYTALGMVLQKRTYLCTSNYSEDYFDFHCLPGGKAPKDGLHWYTACGTPFPNHMEYIVVVCAFCVLGLYIYMQMLRSSGQQYPSTSTPLQVRPKVPKGKQKRY